MSDYARHLGAAREAHRDALAAGTRLDVATEARNRSLARAWAARPGGASWQALLAEFNAGMPERARYGTLRAWVRMGSEGVGRKGREEAS